MFAITIDFLCNDNDDDIYCSAIKFVLCLSLRWSMTSKVVQASSGSTATKTKYTLPTTPTPAVGAAAALSCNMKGKTICYNYSYESSYPLTFFLPSANVLRIVIRNIYIYMQSVFGIAKFGNNYILNINPT